MLELALRLRIGLAKRLNASWTSAGVQGFGFWRFLRSGFGGVRALGDALTAFFAGFFGTDGTLDFLPLEERMILAMIGIY